MSLKKKISGIWQARLPDNTSVLITDQRNPLKFSLIIPYIDNYETELVNEKLTRIDKRD